MTRTGCQIFLKTQRCDHSKALLCRFVSQALDEMSNRICMQLHLLGASRHCISAYRRSLRLTELILAQHDAHPSSMLTCAFIRSAIVFVPPQDYTDIFRSSLALCNESFTLDGLNDRILRLVDGWVTVCSLPAAKEWTGVRGMLPPGSHSDASCTTG